MKWTVRCEHMSSTADHTYPLSPFVCEENSGTFSERNTSVFATSFSPVYVIRGAREARIVTSSRGSAPAARKPPGLSRREVSIFNESDARHQIGRSYFNLFTSSISDVGSSL